jgi:hypothetical protein
MLRRIIPGPKNNPRQGQELGRQEIVARVLHSKNQFSSQRQRPKPNAFDPSPYSELSGIHVTGLSDYAIWTIAVNTLGGVPGRRTVYARADVLVGELLEQRLKAIRDDDPFERHTSITGWPTSDDANKQKEDWKAICLELSESPQVSLVIPPSPITRD